MPTAFAYEFEFPKCCHRYVAAFNRSPFQSQL